MTTYYHCIQCVKDGIPHGVEDDTLMRPDEFDAIVEVTPIPPDMLEQAIIAEWNKLQQTPSYIEGRIAANRGLLTSIASQR